MVRYNTNGSIDNTFGTNGIVITPIGSSELISQLQPLYKLIGKIVLAGYTDNGSNDDFALTRYNIDGSLRYIHSVPKWNTNYTYRIWRR